MAKKQVTPKRNIKHVVYDGHKIYYDAPTFLTGYMNLIAALQKKFKFSEEQAKKAADILMSEDTTKFIYDKQDKTIKKFDLKQSFKPLLRKLLKRSAIRNDDAIFGAVKKTPKEGDKVIITNIKNTPEKMSGIWVIKLWINFYKVFQGKKGREIVRQYPRPLEESIIQQQEAWDEAVKKENWEIRYQTINIVEKTPQEIAERVREYVNSLIQVKAYGTGYIETYRYYPLAINLSTEEVDNTEAGISEYFLGDREYKLDQWAQIQYLGERKNNEDSCLLKFILASPYSKFYFELKKQEVEEGIKMKYFMNFCNEYSIPFEFYNIAGKKIIDNLKNFNFDVVESTHHIMRAIILENHVYPFTGRKPVQISKKPTKKIQCTKKELEEVLIEYLNGKKYPSKLRTDKDGELVSFMMGTKKYFYNPQYNDCVSILKEFNITEKIPTSISYFEIIKIITKRQVNSLAPWSYFPNLVQCKASQILYKSKRKVPEEQIMATDKNKAYSWILANLPYLIYFDFRIHDINPINKKSDEVKFKDQNLYLITTDDDEDEETYSWTILLPRNMAYPGYHLKYCISQGLKFNVLEEYETGTVMNYYDVLVPLYEKFQKLPDGEKKFKNMVNITIGSFERNPHTDINTTVTNIFPETDKVLMQKNMVLKQKEIGKYCMTIETKTMHKSARNMLPISLQVKTAMYRQLYEKIIEIATVNDALSDHKFREEDILAINTDCIYFKGVTPKYTEEEKMKMAKDISGWKITPSIDDYKRMFPVEPQYNEVTPMLELINPNKMPRILHNQYAGAGKTHYIVNKLVPNLEKRNIRYIILVPTHSMLREYRETKVKVDLLQNYTYSNTIPKEDYVIFDEIGLMGMDAHDMLIYLSQENKAYEVFGDFNQMLPVGYDTPINKPHYLKYIFNEIRTEFYNFRNTFTKEYYDNLINGDIDIEKEVKKYSTPLEKAEIAIAFRNETCKITNELKLKMLKLEPFSVGVKYYCNNNDLHDHGFNKYSFGTIISSTDEKIIIQSDDNEGKKFEGTKEKINRNFKLGYCITIYAAQGKTFRSFHYPNEDLLFIKQGSLYNGKNRLAYTLISRLYQEFDRIPQQKALEATLNYDYLGKFVKDAIKQDFKNLESYNRAKGIATTTRTWQEICIDLKIEEKLRVPIKPVIIVNKNGVRWKKDKNIHPTIITKNVKNKEIFEEYGDPQLKIPKKEIPKKEIPKKKAGILELYCEKNKNPFTENLIKMWAQEQNVRHPTRVEHNVQLCFE